MAEALGELKALQCPDKQSTIFATRVMSSMAQMPLCAKKMGNMIIRLLHAIVSKINTFTQDTMPISYHASASVTLRSPVHVGQ